LDLPNFDLSQASVKYVFITRPSLASEPCGFSAMAGKIFQYLRSPRFPRFYQPNAMCEWTLQGPPGTLIILDFTDFQTESNGDYFRVSTSIPSTNK